jgi:ribosome-associated protein
MKLNKADSLALVKLCCLALDEKKAEDLRVMDVSEQSSITDFLVLATGNSAPHLRALRIEVEKALDAAKARIVGMEIPQDTGWMVIDAFDVMIHLFTADQREHYALENLWKDAVEVSVPELCGVAKTAVAPEPAMAPAPAPVPVIIKAAVKAKSKPKPKAAAKPKPKVKAKPKPKVKAKAKAKPKAKANPKPKAKAKPASKPKTSLRAKPKAATAKKSVKQSGIKRPAKKKAAVAKKTTPAKKSVSARRKK